MRINRLAGATGDPTRGGILCHIDEDGRNGQVLSWASNEPVHVQETAKHYATVLIDRLLKQGRVDAVNRINWMSATAAFEKILRDFNEELSRALSRRMDADTAEGKAIEIDLRDAPRTLQ